jgi:hypothetical protein
MGLQGRIVACGEGPTTRAHESSTTTTSMIPSTNHNLALLQLVHSLASKVETVAKRAAFATTFDCLSYCLEYIT